MRWSCLTRRWWEYSKQRGKKMWEVGRNSTIQTLPGLGGFKVTPFQVYVIFNNV